MYFLKTKIKANSINNLSDGRYFSTFAEWVGFNFNPNSTQSVDIATAKEIAGWLHGPRIVGEFDDQPLTRINEVAEALQLDTVQTDIDLDYTKLHPNISTIIKRVVIDDTIDADRLESILMSGTGIAYFLLDFVEKNSLWKDIEKHQALKPAFLQELCEEYRIILALPFTSQNVLSIVEQTQPFAIALASGQEEKVGIRAFDELTAIIEQLEED